MGQADWRKLSHGSGNGAFPVAPKSFPVGTSWFLTNTRFILILHVPFTPRCFNSSLKRRLYVWLGGPSRLSAAPSGLLVCPSVWVSRYLARALTRPARRGDCGLARRTTMAIGQPPPDTLCVRTRTILCEVREPVMRSCNVGVMRCL